MSAGIKLVVCGEILGGTRDWGKVLMSEQTFWWNSILFNKKFYSAATPHCLLWRNCRVQYDDGTHQTHPGYQFYLVIILQFPPRQPPSRQQGDVIVINIVINTPVVTTATLTLSGSNTCLAPDYWQGSEDFSPANGDVCSWWGLVVVVLLDVS